MLDLVYYIGVPVFLALCGGIFTMYNKQIRRIETLENRLDDTEKDLIGVQSDIRYMSRDIKEIKENVQKLVDRSGRRI